MTTLKVNYGGGRLEITTKFGHKYVYVPERDNGVLQVADADVASMLEMTYMSGCNCSQGSKLVRLPYFAISEIN